MILKVLGMRCAVVLPIYTIIIYISLVIPAAFAALQILVAFMEGWSLYTFFSFLGRVILNIYIYAHVHMLILLHVNTHPHLFECPYLFDFYILVVNMNGPDATVAIMQSKTEDFVCNKNFTCCCSCCLVHKDKIRFYRTATWWVWHAWWTRLALIIIATIAYYGGSSVVYILFSLLAAAILMGALIIVINLCKYLFNIFIYIYEYSNRNC